MRRLIVLAAAALALAACHPKPAVPDMAAESKAFMAKVATEPGVRVLPSGVAYKIVRSGPANGQRPHLEDEVKVNYEGKLTNGRVFDSSYERGQPAAMPLAHLVPAW
jgi:peptidylprolyl isomerase/FKBP-type peptidyl-prolyl cis-trans isomerase FklB